MADLPTTSLCHFPWLSLQTFGEVVGVLQQLTLRTTHK